jgi:hypothetical protein
MCRTTLILLMLVAAGAVRELHAAELTLSDRALMLLDTEAVWNGARVIRVIDVPGPGVQFDFQFPTTVRPGNCQRYVSCTFAGTGALMREDLSRYDRFSLTFRLLAVDGETVGPAGGMLVVGAMVQQVGNGARYRPAGLSLRGRRMATSRTSITRPLAGVGIACHLNRGAGWEPDTVVSLLVQPTEGAEALVPPPMVAGLQLPVSSSRFPVTGEPVDKLGGMATAVRVAMRTWENGSRGFREMFDRVHGDQPRSPCHPTRSRLNIAASYQLPVGRALPAVCVSLATRPVMHAWALACASCSDGVAFIRPLVRPAGTHHSLPITHHCRRRRRDDNQRFVISNRWVAWAPRKPWKRVGLPSGPGMSLRSASS